MLNARALAAAALTPLAANAQNQINMPTGVSDAGAVITELGAEIYGLHMLIFWISVVIGVSDAMSESMGLVALGSISCGMHSG